MKKITFFLGVSSLLSLIFTGYIIFYITPLEITQGFVQKIMYIHVPSVLIGYVAIFGVFICSVGYLRKQSIILDIIAQACAELGALLMGICLVTGAIWGKPTWNTYWTWDARLTITLIIFLIFCGYILIRTFSEYGTKQSSVAAVVGILGFLSVPLNHLAVNWWRTLHQPSTMFSRDNVISPDLKYTLILSIATFFILALYLLFARINLEHHKRLRYSHLANLKH